MSHGYDLRLLLGALGQVSCGLVYGLNAVALPVFVSRVFGRQRFATAYGKVFTAWGTAGVLAPWFAGRLYDVTGAYSAALVVSSASLLIAGCAATALPRAAPPN